MTPKGLVFEDFADKLGHDFALDGADVPAIPLSLVEAAALPNRQKLGARPPFSLVFLGKDPRVLPQRIYRLQHPALGELEIFLVPVGRNEHGVNYQATFN